MRWLAGLVAPALLAGCQSATSSGQGSLEAIASRSELRAVVVGDDLPYAQKSGSGYEGLSITVLDAILNELNETLEPAKPIQLSLEPASSVADGLQRITGGQADIACGVAFTWARQQELDFTLPFAMGGVRVLVPAGASGTPDGLVGQKVAVVEGSASATILKGLAPKADYVAFASPEQALDAMRSGKVQALGGDSLWLRANQQQVAPNAELRPAIPYARSGVGCVVAANNRELRVLGSIAIGQMMQAYLDDNAEVVKAVNRWVGPGSAVNLSSELIARYFNAVLSTVAEFAHSQS